MREIFEKKLTDWRDWGN